MPLIAYMEEPNTLAARASHNEKHFSKAMLMPCRYINRSLCRSCAASPLELLDLADSQFDAVSIVCYDSN